MFKHPDLIIRHPVFCNEPKLSHESALKRILPSNIKEKHRPNDKSGVLSRTYYLRQLTSNSSALREVIHPMYIYKFSRLNFPRNKSLPVKTKYILRNNIYKRSISTNFYYTLLYVIIPHNN